MNIVACEFLVCIWNGCVVEDLVYEGVDVDCVEGLGEIYCYKCCAMWRFFLVEATDDGVYDQVKCSGGRMLSLEAMLMRTSREVGFDDGFKGFCNW